MQTPTLYSTLLGLIALALASACTPREAQRTSGLDEPTQELAVVGFYNLENLFDVDDDPTKRGDDEWLPGSPKAWTPKRYVEKLSRLARVINDMGGAESPGGPAVVGVCEVENARVLEDLVRQPLLARSNYRVIHVESPDYRGIDNGLLYRADQFEPTTTQALYVHLGYRDDSTRRTTRDVLAVKGKLLGDEVHVLVNHWPSRRGGQAKSAPRRAIAAHVARGYVDSVLAVDPNADILLVGDFNDDPVSPSITEVLKAATKKSEARATGLYNPMVSLYRQGEGSLGYRDSWNLFDQTIVSAGLAEAGDDWSLRNARVFRASYLLNPAGRFKGYPLRTYVGDTFQGGYSDHLPAVAVLTRPKAG